MRVGGGAQDPESRPQIKRGCGRGLGPKSAKKSNDHTTNSAVIVWFRGASSASGSCPGRNVLPRGCMPYRSGHSHGNCVSGLVDEPKVTLPKLKQLRQNGLGRVGKGRVG